MRKNIVSVEKETESELYFLHKKYMFRGYLRNYEIELNCGN